MTTKWTRPLFPLALLALLGMLSLHTPSAQSAPAQPTAKFDDYLQLERRIQVTAERVRPAVVGVRMSSSSGSGCFISDDGWVATAGHVTGPKPGTKCRIVTYGGETFEAVTQGWHEAMDYALIKADTKGKKVPFCELGESEKVIAGQWLIPMGHPLGPEAGRDAVVRAGRCLLPENDRSMIVTDAPVISGDSGGPVFDLDGKIIAINQSIQTNNVSINNVTPVKLMKELLAELKGGKGYGNAAAPSWGKGMKEPAEGGLVGKEIQSYQQAMKALQERNLKRCTDLFDELLKPEKRTADVLYNAACAYSLRSAELKGDEADAAAKKAVAALTRATAAGWRDMDHAASDTDLDPVRERADFKEWLANGRRASKRPVVGMTVRSFKGVRVDDVLPNSPAAKAGFEVNDIIERVGMEKVEKATDWVEWVIERGLSAEQEIKVSRGGKRTVLNIGVPAFGARVFGQGGARIIELYEGGLAFNAGLREDDVIIRVGETEIDGALDFANAMMLIDGNSETELEVKRGYSRQRIKFSYSTGDVGGDAGDGTLPRPDWKQGDNLLVLWSKLLSDKAAGTVFPVKQRGKQVAFATVVAADGLLLTKASEIDESQKIELLDGTTPFEAKVRARNDRHDLALLKCERTFKRWIDFAAGTTTEEFPRIGTMLATVDSRGNAMAHGFVALPPYDSDKIAGEPDPNSPFLGINAKDAQDGGAEVTAVTVGMPADKAGMKVGDIVLKMAGQPVANWNDLIAMIRGRKSTDKVTLSVKRGDQFLELEVQLVPRAEALGQKAPSKGTGKPELGIYQSRPTDDKKGVSVGHVKPGSPAELAGISSGEVLLKLDDQPISQQKDIDDIVKSRKIGDTLALVLLRDGKETRLDVELAEEDAPPPPPGQGRPNVKGPINSRYTHMGKVIQHDGVVLPSQQGSPVFDLHGNLVGLNIARADRTRTFALSAKEVASILRELLAARD
ncbi:MAG: PDZ domain-containing protein [Planctomycetes bacterium]|nr:PDZ domain-containing protein [Planctomycetota bacterium]MCB9934958.1 PDZ domain-containing protein [Planctomycetota bacterium]